MKSTFVGSSDVPQSAAPAKIELVRYFYSAAAALLFVLMFWGFQHFYLHGKAYPGRPIPPPIRGLIIAHGIAMSAWMLLLVVQPLLIVNRKYGVHMWLGKTGAVLAAVLVVLGIKVGIAAVQVSPPDLVIWGLTYKQFLAVPIISILLFGGFVAAGVWNRRRPERHRPLMLLATLAAIPAAVSRIDTLNAFYLGTVWETIFGPFFMTLVVGVLFLVAKSVLSRSFDRCYAAGLAGLTLASALIMQLATTQAWDQVATFLLRY